MRRFFVYIAISVVFSPPTAYAQLPDLLGVINSDTVLSHFGYQITPVGDQNADGYSDILIWSFKEQNYLYYGGDPLDTIPDLVFPNTYPRTNNIGDINGDSVDDFVLMWGWWEDGRLNLYYGGENLDTVPELWFGTDSLWGQGYTVRTDDINSDGADELISWSLDQKSLVLFELGDSPDSVPDLEIQPTGYDSPRYSFGEGVISGDYNGDGLIDLATNLRPYALDSINGSVYLYWAGSSYDTLPDMIVRRPGAYIAGGNSFGSHLVDLGDFNGDGWDDFLAGSGIKYKDTVNFIYFGGPTIDSIPDIVIYDILDRFNPAGDVNNDGYPDMIAGYPDPSSSAGHVMIYLGGPGADGVWDLRIRNIDIDRFQYDFGKYVTGIGDFNGDGIDDFAFSAINSLYQGQVFIFSGWDGGTDVDYEYTPGLPAGYSLSQNYPNPFNLSTTIEFSLPSRSEVNLTIYNILGECIGTLISESLPAGSYRTQWNGTDKRGQTAASGVYLYELTAGEISLSKKMVVVK